VLFYTLKILVSKYVIFYYLKWDVEAHVLRASHQYMTQNPVTRAHFTILVIPPFIFNIIDGVLICQFGTLKKSQPKKSRNTISMVSYVNGIQIYYYFLPLPKKVKSVMTEMQV
jgi:hypothetical protein